MSDDAKTPQRPRRVTAQMVAELAGVSRSAVSRAFSGGGYVDAKKRARIHAIAAEIGYQPNALAAGLQIGRSNLVAIVVGRVSNPHDTALVHQLCNALNAQGVWPVLINGARSATEHGVSVEDALRLPLDALIVRGGSMSIDLVNRCAKLGIPMICYGRPLKEHNVDAVYCRNFEGMRAATDLLLSTGRRSFAFISGPPAFYAASERRRGLLHSLETVGRGLSAEIESDFTVAGGHKAAHALLRDNRDIDALICANDACAIGALGALTELGIKVPQDIAVIGFDDIDMASWPMFNLTTMRIPLDLIVKAILDLLQRNLMDHDKTAECLKVDPHLILRGTH